MKGHFHIVGGIGKRSWFWVSSCISLASEARMVVLPLFVTKSHFLLRIKTLARTWVPSRDVGEAPLAHPSSPTREHRCYLRYMDNQRWTWKSFINVCEYTVTSHKPDILP